MIPEEILNDPFISADDERPLVVITAIDVPLTGLDAVITAVENQRKAHPNVRIRAIIKTKEV